MSNAQIKVIFKDKPEDTIQHQYHVTTYIQQVGITLLSISVKEYCELHVSNIHVHGRGLCHSPLCMIMVQCITDENYHNVFI